MFVFLSVQVHGLSVVKAGHVKTAGKLLHPILEVSDFLLRLAIFEEESLELLRIAWKYKNRNPVATFTSVVKLKQLNCNKQVQGYTNNIVWLVFVYITLFRILM